MITPEKRAYARGLEAGRKERPSPPASDECQQIIAWLRIEEAKWRAGNNTDAARALLQAADGIERGAHLESQRP